MKTEESRIVRVVALLATIGFLVVFLIVLIIFLLDRVGGKNIIQENIDNTNQVDNVRSVSGEDEDILYESDEYGIHLNYTPVVIAIEEELNKGEGVLDCRKYSASMREHQIEQGNICFRVKFVIDDVQYIMVETGNVPYTDPKEVSIIDSSNTTITPTTKINLPLLRHYVSDFPVNFNGNKVNYENSQEYIFYKGQVYKGADQYSITIRGEVNDAVVAVLQSIELD